MVMTIRFLQLHRYLLLKLIILILVCASNTRADAVELILAYEDKEQPPYYMGNTLLVSDDKPGVSVEIIKMLADMIDGLEIKLERCPWKRCLHSLKYNTVNGIFNASYKESRLEIGRYPTTNGILDGPVDKSKRITLISYSFYVLKNSAFKWDGKAIKNVKNRIIGAPAGYSVVNDLKKKGMIVYESHSTKSNLERLVLKRVDAVALQDVTADNILSSNPSLFAKIEKRYPPIATKPYYLMLSHEFVEQHPTLAKRIWNTIKIIRETKFDEIALKYADTN